MELEQLLVKAVAKKKGIPEEEAKALVEAMKDSDEFEDIKQSLARLVDLGQLQQQLPPHVQPLAMPLMFQAMSPSSSAEKIAEKVAMISAAIRAAYGDDYKQLVEDLRREIQELKEEKQRREMEEVLKQTMEAINQYIRALEDRIAQLEQEKAQPKRPEPQDELDALEKQLEKLRRMYEKARKLGLIDDGKNELDPEKAAEILRTYGYRVEPPPSYEQMRRMLEEELKRKEQEIRKKVEEELAVQQRKMTMAMELAMALIDGIVTAFGGKQEGGGGEVKKFISQVRALAGGLNGGADAGGSGTAEADTQVGGSGGEAG